MWDLSIINVGNEEITVPDPAVTPTCFGEQTKSVEDMEDTVLPPKGAPEKGGRVIRSPSGGGTSE